MTVISAGVSNDDDAALVVDCLEFDDTSVIVSVVSE